MAETTDLQRLLVSLEANYNKFQKELGKANGVAKRSARTIESDFRSANAGVLASFTRLTGGIQKQLGQGVLSEVGRLRTSLVQLISPVGLITSAVAGLAGAFGSWIAGAFAGAANVEDQLKTHADLVDAIKEAYDNARKGVVDFGDRSLAVLNLLNRAQEAQLRGQLTNMAQDLVEALTAIQGAPGLDPSGVILRYFEFRDAILALRESAVDGTPDIVAFSDAVAAVADADPTNEALRDLATELVNMAVGAEEVQRALLAAAQVIADAAGGAEAYAEALSAINELMPETERTTLEVAEALLRQGIAAATTTEQVNALYAAFFALVGVMREAAVLQGGVGDDIGKLVSDPKAPATVPSVTPTGTSTPTGGGGSARDAIQETIDALNRERVQLGLTGQALAIYNALQDAGIDSGHERAAAVIAAATALYQEEAAIEAATEATEAFNERMEELKATASDLLKGFIADMREGKTLAESFGNVLAKLADRLIDVGIDKLVTGSFGTLGNLGRGTGTGTFGRLLGTLAPTLAPVLGTPRIPNMAPTRSMPNQGAPQRVMLDIGVDPKTGNIAPFVRREAYGVSVRVVGGAMKEATQRERRRG